MVHVSVAREWCTRVVHESGARERGSADLWVNSLQSLRRLAWGKSRQTLVDWAWDLQTNFSRLGTGPPGQTLVDWEWGLQDKQAVEKSRLVEEEMLLSQESRWYCYKAAPGTKEQQKNSRRTAAPPQRSQDQGSRQWWSEDWRGKAVVDAGAEVILMLLAEVGLLIYPGADFP